MERRRRRRLRQSSNSRMNLLRPRVVDVTRKNQSTLFIIVIHRKKSHIYSVYSFFQDSFNSIFDYFMNEQENRIQSPKCWPRNTSIRIFPVRS